MEKFARSKKTSPIPAYSQSTIRRRAAVVDEVRVEEIVVAGTLCESSPRPLDAPRHLAGPGVARRHLGAV